MTNNGDYFHNTSKQMENYQEISREMLQGFEGFKLNVFIKQIH